MNNPNRSPERTRFFWRVWRRSIQVRRPQAALAAGSLLIGAAVTAMLFNLYGDLRRKMTQEFRSFGANIVISPPAVAGSARHAPHLMNESEFTAGASLEARARGVVAAPMLYVVASVRRASANTGWSPSENVVAAGTEFSALERLAGGWRILAGDWPADSDDTACVAGARVASTLHLSLGNRLEIGTASTSRPTACRVAAVIATGRTEDNQLFLPLVRLQNLSGLEGKISLIELNVSGGTRQVALEVGALRKAFSNEDVRPIRQIVYSQGKVLETLRILLISLTALIALVVGLCVTATTTAIVLERRKDVAMMKALGASDGLVMRLFLAEGAAMGLAGALAGFALGAVLASVLLRRIFDVRLDLLWWTLPAVCALSILLAVIATYFPVKMVRNVQPAMILKGE